jgi:hypothetical protein
MWVSLRLIAHQFLVREPQNTGNNFPLPELLAAGLRPYRQRI